ncbi:unnamed protein product [Dibothriocephalus latus]|uniref:Uncharacterized protein n=1 Tax=Dibothriocephalus latus TaxID=60516 RepID=A0A3P6TB68_DIBLA|nr:unnamed protein product [Dibothriocephalus latus]
MANRDMYWLIYGLWHLYGGLKGVEFFNQTTGEVFMPKGPFDFGNLTTFNLLTARFMSEEYLNNRVDDHIRTICTEPKSKRAGKAKFKLKLKENCNKLLS